MYRNLTWQTGHEVHLGLTGNRTAVIPQEIADNQRGWDGRSFFALLPNRRWMRVRLVGGDYGLDTGGTGEMVVRPLGYVKGGHAGVMRSVAAAALGASTSRRKATASRANGKLGGRPRVNL